VKFEQSFSPDIKFLSLLFATSCGKRSDHSISHRLSAQYFILFLFRVAGPVIAVIPVGYRTRDAFVRLEFVRTYPLLIRKPGLMDRALHAVVR